MPMPTTRRGRAQFYKERSQRRRRRALNRHRRFALEVGDFYGQGITRRALDYSGFAKQRPRVYPLPGRHAHLPLSWAGRWRVEPGDKVLGVVEYTAVVPVGKPATWHWPVPKVGLVLKRVLSMPKLRAIPVMPYDRPRAAVPPTAFYPFEFYPSGRRSWSWSTGIRPLPEA